MGPFVPVLAAVGGGSAVAGGITLATAAVGAYGAYSQYESGQAQKAESRIAAEREATAGRQEEIERRRGLMHALSVRSAEAGARGATTDGSIGALTRRDIRDNRNDLLVSGYNTVAKQRALRASGSNAARAATGGAVTSLMDTAVDTYQAVGGRAKKPK